MNKAVQEAVQGRDGAGTVDDEVKSVPWVPRTDGKTALLVSERTTVFDRKAMLPPPLVEPSYDVGALGPMPTEWTADLVHCRLLSVDALVRRLPRAKVPAQYRSFLGELQPQDAAPRSDKPLSTEEEHTVDWTLARLSAWGSIDKAVLMGVMAGHKIETIAKVTVGIARREGGQGLKRPSIYKRYQRNTKIMAEDWQLLGLRIDPATQKCWLNFASTKRK